MKEIDFGNFTLCEYDNETIYKNERKIRLWCLISFIVAIITAITYTVANTMLNAWSLDFSIIYFIFYLNLIFQPYGLFRRYSKAGRRPSEIPADEIIKFRARFKPSNKKITHFPFASTICEFLSLEFLKIIMLFMVGLMGLPNFGAYVGIWAYHLGYMFPSTVFIYVALIFLIKNCILMKNEWETNPPSIVLKSKAELQQERNNTIEQNKYTQYKKLIEKCGIKFFIKYYKQIKKLPLRDVTITENYTPNEREERLLAAKKIIDSDLTEFTLKEILKTYSDILDETEITQAKSLLAELPSS